MPVPFPFDWKNPDYLRVFEWRADVLNWIRENPHEIPDLKLYYRDNPAQFIIDWGMTFDPRLARRNLPATVPFILFPRQEEAVAWIVERWRAGEGGLIPKSRDMGISWLMMSLSCTLALFHNDLSIGWGSRKAELVDTLGDPDSLLEKARLFLTYIPVEFRGGWNREDHSTHMKIEFPESGSIITGEGGDKIGRGGRQSIYFVDEAAHLERPKLIDAALSATTDCRIDLSSVNGTANPFAQKRRRGHIKEFPFNWRDDPRKDDDWYAKQVFELDPVTLAQEVDMDENASVEGVLIPSAWVQAAVDADKKLGISAHGGKYGALDVADEGVDKNAFAGRLGVRLEVLEEWSGKGSDIYYTVQRAFGLCDDYGLRAFDYDSDGIGSGCKGDARVINESRKPHERITANAYRGSGEVHKPEAQMVKGRLNKDFFANRKAQAWWQLRIRFQNTYRAVIEGLTVDLSQIIIIPSDLPMRPQLCAELSQPTYTPNGAGKIVVDKLGEGEKSPNLADSVVICYAGSNIAMNISAELLKKV